MTAMDLPASDERQAVLDTWADICERYNWGFVVVNAETQRFVIMNRAFASSHGYEVDELIDRSVPFVYAPEYRADVPANMHKTREKGAHAFESVHIRKDGTTFPVQVDVTLVRTDHRQLFAVCVQDISERKDAEAAAARMEKRYRRLIDAAPLWLWAYNLDRAELTVASEGAKILTGYANTRFVERPSFWLDLVREEDRQGVIDANERTRRDKVRTSYDARIKHNDGTTRWMHVTVIPELEDAGEVIGVYGFAVDLSERARAEHALVHAREDIEGKVQEHVPTSDAYSLTFRELSVLHLVAEGKSDKEIAEVLGIRPLTASKHLTNILSKMNASSRTEAGVRAVREGLVS